MIKKPIKNLTDLRNHAILTLNKLESKKIKLEEAGVTAKIYENIISTVKTQMEYAKMVGRKPDIDFLGNCTGDIIETTIIKKQLL